MDSFRANGYRISLEPDLESFTFRGRVIVSGEMESPGSEIALNAAELTIRRCILATDGSEEPCTVRLDPAGQSLSIGLPRETRGPLKLVIEYDGLLNDRMAGFYRSHYRLNGKDHYIAVTQFEENDARRALPCQDHPSRKAVFDVEMIVPRDLTAVSNTPPVSEEPVGAEKKRVRFASTPLMSTYLLFFGIGAFETATDGLDPRVRALTVPGRIGHTAYGLDFGRRSLRFCESYYGVPYPLAKLDLIAVPDFAYGAMENWGAITFRENLLLHYPGITSRGGEQRICEVIAHEIAHQWFGDLVSPSDWKYLWLNESFATLFGYRVVDDAHPDWGVWEQFIGGSTAGAMARDAMHDTPAIEIRGDDPVVINASNAPILYSKGASILRQIEGYIGGEAFREGLGRYLRAHAYGNAASPQLWAAFEEASKKPVTSMMESWISQPGYPLVTVEREGRRLTLRQRRFTYLAGSFDQRWIVPVRILVRGAGGRERIEEALLSEEAEEVLLPEEPSAYKLNAGQTGFYRVRYAHAGDLARLQALVADRSLAAEDRWGLQSDLFALVRCAEASLGDYLRFLEAYAGERAFLPLAGICGNLSHAHLVVDEPAARAVAAAGLPLLKAALEAIGLEPSEGEAATVSLLRSRIMLPAVTFGDVEAARFGAAKFDALATGAVVHADLRSAVMEIAAWSGGPEVFGRLLALFRGSESEPERLNVLSALGSLSRREQLEEALRFALDEVPERNKYMPIASIAANPRAIPWMWSWYRSHQDDMEKLHRMHHERVIAAVLPLAGMDHAEEAREFFAAYVRGKPELADIVRLSLERMEVNLSLRRRGLGEPATDRQEG